VVNLDDIATIPKALLQKRIATLHAAKMAAVEAAIRFALALS
jgi:mRNA-degrading endonuclease toxin of MazEF toxin-antitoxin module